MTARPDVLLTLIAPAALEEPLVDLLLAAPQIAFGFTVSLADGLGTRVRLVGASEQVRGRGRRVRFEVALAASDVAPLRAHLHQGLPQAGVYFWTTALIDGGVLS